MAAFIKIFHALCVDSDHGRVDVVSHVEEFVCGGADDQHDRAARDLRGDVYRAAGVSRETEIPAPAFRLPGGTIVAILSLLLIVWLLMNSTLAEAIVSAYAAGVGLLIYIVYTFFDRIDRRNLINLCTFCALVVRKS